MSIHDGHRDRMRRQLKTSGMDSLSDVQVLEVLLYYAAPRGDTNPTAHALLSRFGTLDSVFSAPESELKKVNGVGDAAAQLIRLVPQVARRCLMSRSAQIEILDTIRPNAVNTCCRTSTAKARRSCIFSASTRSARRSTACSSTVAA